ASFETSIPRLALPVIISMGLDYLSVAIFFSIVGHISESSLGGGRIAFQVMVLAYGIFSAFGAGSRVMIGRALGEQDEVAAGADWRAGQRVLLAFALPAAAVLLLLPWLVGSVFTGFPPVLSAANSAIRMVGACLPLMAWTLGNVSALRANGKTKWDMYC